jgi:hypothetical protein
LRRFFNHVRRGDELDDAAALQVGAHDGADDAERRRGTVLVAEPGHRDRNLRLPDAADLDAKLRCSRPRAH